MMPLLSMDIFLEGYHRRLAQAADGNSLRKLAKQWGWQQVHDFELMLIVKQKVIIVTDNQQRIVFASNNMTEMNGYQPSEVLGQTPRMFQGVATEAKTRAVIRKSMSRLRPFHVVLTNYRKTGEPYLCEIEAIPVLTKTHFPTHFIAFENIVYL